MGIHARDANVYRQASSNDSLVCNREADVYQTKAHALNASLWNPVSHMHASTMLRKRVVHNF